MDLKDQFIGNEYKAKRESKNRQTSMDFSRIKFCWSQ